MKIKKHHNKNEYVLSGGQWIRNFTRSIWPIDITHITMREDYHLLTQNEIFIRTLNIPEIGSENLRYEKCLIVSDGYGFNDVKGLLRELPKDVCVLGVNRSLAKWQLNGELLKRQLNFFVANNPYPDCASCLPKHRYFPQCIVSSRTNPEFVKQYKGTLYKYIPVFDTALAGDTGSYFQIDDYRNPVCAAIGLAYRFGAKKLGLFCCDDAFEQERPAAEKLHNGLWAYPQHKMSHSLIEGNLYWLQHSGAEVKDFSSGYKYGSIETLQHTECVKFFAS